MRALDEGIIEPTANALSHLDQCLQCRNCEAVCPSGVQYGHTMEMARAAVLSSGSAPLAWRLRAAFLRQVIARPRRLAILARLLRAYRVSGLRAVAERIPFIRDRVLFVPPVSGRAFREAGVVARPRGAVAKRVALLTGCIMPLAYGRVHRATVRVLARNGCEVVVPPGQVCCGALHGHNGDAATARMLARRNVDAFLEDPPDAVVVNSAGCGAAMKEYARLLIDDPDYGAKARRFSELVRDVHEFLVDLPFAPPESPSAISVTYQDSCHLAHAQRVREAPRRVLQSIPGVTFVEMEHADRCCGSAGIYAFTQPKMSLQLLESKMHDVRGTGAQVLATANPGCMAQLEAGLRRYGVAGRVVHVIELLDAAYGAQTDR